MDDLSISNWFFSNGFVYVCMFQVVAADMN